jgi:hypothetical protein
MKEKDIKSVHIVDGKKVIVLKEKERKYKPSKKKMKAKNYYNALKNSK